ncbi:hypothetical protein XENOCAPTIV_005803 [Xenoophorus captivus]|uniref:Uncharacterized protein n=1 Tax=Xenoophorus captivus TaxID=1517983 RepID=A0ABV0QMH0_9TELE
MKVMNRTGDKGQPCWSPTCTGYRFNLILAMRTILLLCLCRDRMAPLWSDRGDGGRGSSCNWWVAGLWGLDKMLEVQAIYHPCERGQPPLSASPEALALTGMQC